jgi:hypothetical protein
MDPKKVALSLRERRAEDKALLNERQRVLEAK